MILAHPPASARGHTAKISNIFDTTAITEKYLIIPIRIDAILNGPAQWQFRY